MIYKAVSVFFAIYIEVCRSVQIAWIYAAFTLYRTKARTIIKYFVVSKLKSIDTSFEMTYNQGIERCHNLVSLMKGENEHDLRILQGINQRTGKRW